jgi:hypothetical protein
MRVNEGVKIPPRGKLHTWGQTHVVKNRPQKEVLELDKNGSRAGVRVSTVNWARVFVPVVNSLKDINFFTHFLSFFPRQTRRDKTKEIFSVFFLKWQIDGKTQKSGGSDENTGPG